MGRKPLQTTTASIQTIFPDDPAPVREGYKVRLSDVPDDVPYDYAFFPDTTYGSSAEAYKAAQAWTDRTEVDEDDTRNIVRIEIPEIEQRVKVRRATFGWQVRMQRKGTSYTRFFNDNHFGGKIGALKAAQYWRDWKDAQLSKADPKRTIEKSRTSRSQFGVPGLRVHLVNVGDHQYKPYLQATWTQTSEDGERKRKRKMMSLEKHSPKKATIELCKVLADARLRNGQLEEVLRETGEPSGDGGNVEPQQPAISLTTDDVATLLDPDVRGALRPVPKRDERLQAKVFWKYYRTALRAVQERLPELQKEAKERSASEASA